MEKRIICLTLLFFALMNIVFALPAIVSQVPVNSSVLQGNSSESFMVQLNETATSASVYIDGIEQVMGCMGVVCDKTVNMAFMTDNVTHGFFYVANSIIFPSSAFIIDRIPSTSSNFSAVGVTETGIQIVWNANTENDIQHYRITRNNLFLVNTTSTGYLDTGLPTGIQQNYTVQAIDGRDQASAVASANAIPEDMTPPSLISLTPATGTLFPANPITFEAVYDENVTFQVLTGGFPLVQQGLDENHTVTINFGANGSFYLVLNATDAAGNSLLTPYVVMVGPNTTSINLTVLGITGISDVCYGIKTDAFAVGDQWILRCDLVYSGLDNLTVRFDDMLGSLDSIDFTLESQPTAFCLADYDSGTQDIVASPAFNVINVTNVFGTTVHDCPDTNPSSAVTYSVIWKIPVPLGQVPDTYALVYQWAFDIV